MWLSLRLDCIRPDWAVWHFLGIKSETADHDFSFSCQVNQTWSPKCLWLLTVVRWCMRFVFRWCVCSFCSCTDMSISSFTHTYTVNKRGLGPCGCLWWNAVDVSSKKGCLESELLCRKAISKCLSRFLYFCTVASKQISAVWSFSRVSLFELSDICFLPLILTFPREQCWVTGEVFRF